MDSAPPTGTEAPPVACLAPGRPLDYAVGPLAIGATGRRVAAGLLDLALLLLLLVPQWLFVVALSFGNQRPSRWFVMLPVLSFLLVFGPESCTGRTAGKWLTSLKVISDTPGVAHRRSLLKRWALKHLGVWPLATTVGIGMLIDGGHEGLWLPILSLLAVVFAIIWPLLVLNGIVYPLRGVPHDRLAHTTVIWTGKPRTPRHFRV